MDGRFIDYYQWLEVHFTASDEVIKAAYRKLSQKYHPDNMTHKGHEQGDPWQLMRINEAYEVLSNPEKKKVYMEQYAAYHDGEGILKGQGFYRSMMDFSVTPVRQSLLQYLYLIQHRGYEDAYRLLSRYNRRHLFKRDFVEWQGLVAGIHELLSFDCTFVESGTIQFSDDRLLADRKYMKFRVKVTEYNHLMQREDEDFFDRMLVLDEDGWHVLLMQRQVKGVIKRYKKLTETYRRNSNMLITERRGKEHVYATGFVSKKSFLNNCEHEQLRYLRYDTEFSVLCIHVKKDGRVEQLRQLLEANTRVLDSITYLKRGILLVLLPETGEKQGKLTFRKLMALAQEKDLTLDVTGFRCLEQRYTSVKELLNEVTKIQ